MNSFPAYLDKAGQIIFVRFQEGKPCPYYIIDSKIAKRYAGLSAMHKDLTLVRDGFKRLTQPQEQLLKVSLLYFCIITYGKCFADAEGRGTKLQENSCYDSESHKKTHRRLIDMRNTFIAHAGKGEYEMYPVSLELSPELDRKQIFRIVFNGVSQIHQDPFIDDYLVLVETLLEHVDNLIKKALKKLEADIDALDLEQIYQNAITPDLSMIFSVGEALEYRSKL